MLTLDQRLAVVTASNTNLVNWLIELNLLRDKVRKAQLAAPEASADRQIRTKEGGLLTSSFRVSPVDQSPARTPEHSAEQQRV